MKKFAVLKLLALLLVSMFMAGCKSNDIDAFLKPHQAEVTLAEYKLQPPDSITISCSKVPQLNGVTQTIRSDGKVSYELLGEFVAAGKTPKALAGEITEKVKGLYALSDEYPLDVRVVKEQSKYYYVFGEVQKEGAMVYTGRVTALQALALNPPQVTGWKTEIKVIRPTSDPVLDSKTGKWTYNEEKMFTLNLEDMIHRGDTSRNVLLAEGDIVYVPPTPLAAVANILAEFVRPIGLAMQPFSSYYQMQRYQSY